jgi:hypothetical protein
MIAVALLSILPTLKKYENCIEGGKSRTPWNVDWATFLKNYIRKMSVCHRLAGWRIHVIPDWASSPKTHQSLKNDEKTSKKRKKNQRPQKTSRR